MSRAALATQGNALISALEKQRQTAQFEANNNTGFEQLGCRVEAEAALPG